MNLTDKMLLVSLRKVDELGSENYDTFFGVVSSFNENTVIVSRFEGDEVELPFDEGYFELAEFGESYELKNGQVCEEVDFIMQMTVFSNDEAYDKFKDLC